MSVQIRNNVKSSGSGPLTIVFAHGFGCDQNMWRWIEPAFNKGYHTILFDLVGCGKSDVAAYDITKYSTLDGYATDVIDVIDEFGEGPVVFVGHSVSAMIGAIAANRRPGLITAHVMIGPSPSYISEGTYQGGFSRDDIDSLLTTLESNYLGWSSAMAPVIMGAPEQPELAIELTNSFCQTDPDIAKRFARVTFLSDNRADVAKLVGPVLILQSSDDFIAPLEVGKYLANVVPVNRLEVIDNSGHCLHLSQPQACIASIQRFINSDVDR